MNDSYQEVYVYRDVTREVVEEVYFKLINTATNIFNRNIDFKKMGYDLGEVFKRTLKGKSSICLSKSSFYNFYYWKLLGLLHRDFFLYLIKQFKLI